MLENKKEPLVVPILNEVDYILSNYQALCYHLFNVQEGM